MKSVVVLVLRSHSGGNKMWEHLKSNWKDYGNIELNISVKHAFDAELLDSISPDVIICGDTAGAPYQFTNKEIESLTSYLEKGIKKHIIGTYALFHHQEGHENRRHIYDNRKMGKIFGIDPNLTLTTRRLGSKPKYNALNQNKILWKNLSVPFISNGYASTQVPSTLKWFTTEQKAIGLLENTEILARSDDGSCVIINHKTPKYSSMYISHMPEYDSLTGDRKDAQFLFNCIAFTVSQNVYTSLTDLCLNSIPTVLGTPAVIPPPLEVYIKKSRKCKITE
ncbi:Uncharacterized protein QTN25_000959 [Entamoeba marina]